MSDFDPWQKRYHQIGIVVGLLTALGLLFTLRKDVREEILGKRSEISNSGNPGELTEKRGPVHPGGETSQGSEPTGQEPTLEKQPLKALPGRYINTVISKREGMKGAAILVTQDSGESLPNLESAIAHLLAKRGIEAVQSFFKPAFIQEVQAKSLFDGDWTVSEQLQLGRHVDYVLIGFGKVSYSPTQELGGLLTANLELDLKCLNVVSQRVCGSKTYSSPGAGYTQGTALHNAVEHLQQQLESFVREAF